MFVCYASWKLAEIFSDDKQSSLSSQRLIMFTLKKTFSFSAGHQLIHHDGKCKHPHGHSYILTVEVSSPTLIASGPKTNMVMDFEDIDAVVKPMIEKYLDHCWLNDTLNNNSVSCEYTARWIYEHLKPQMPLLTAITLNETQSSQVTYRPQV